MRARWLKPDFFRDRKVATMGPVAALVYQALWVEADDSGVAHADPDRIKSEMFFMWPGISEALVRHSLGTMHALGRIRFYQVGDDLFAQIVNFVRHQQVHKPSKFRNIPDINDLHSVVPEWCGTTSENFQASPPSRHLDTQTPRRPDTKTPNPVAVAPETCEGFDVFWAAYPKRAGANPKVKAREAFAKRVEEGVPIIDLQDGAARYAAFLAATGKVNTEFVKQAVAWLSPTYRGWEETWLPPADDGDLPAFPHYPTDL